MILNLGKLRPWQIYFPSHLIPYVCMGGGGSYRCRCNICSKYCIGTVFLRLPVDTSDVVSDTTRPVNY